MTMQENKGLWVEERLLDVAILYHVKNIVSNLLTLNDEKYSQISKETNLVSDLGSDSLDQMEILMQLETLFGFGEIPEEEARKTSTIGHIFDYIKMHSKKTISELVAFDDSGFNKARFLSDIESHFDVQMHDKASVGSLEDVLKILAVAA